MVDSNGEKYRIVKILTQFNNTNDGCPDLINKIKLFVLDLCTLEPNEEYPRNNNKNEDDDTESSKKNNGDDKKDTENSETEIDENSSNYLKDLNDYKDYCIIYKNSKILTNNNYNYHVIASNCLLLQALIKVFKQLRNDIMEFKHFIQYINYETVKLMINDHIAWKDNYNVKNDNTIDILQCPYCNVMYYKIKEDKLDPILYQSSMNKIFLVGNSYKHNGNNGYGLSEIISNSIKNDPIKYFYHKCFDKTINKHLMRYVSKSMILSNAIAPQPGLALQIFSNILEADIVHHMNAAKSRSTTPESHSMDIDALNAPTPNVENTTSIADENIHDIRSDNNSSAHGGGTHIIKQEKTNVYGRKKVRKVLMTDEEKNDGLEAYLHGSNLLNESPIEAELEPGFLLDRRITKLDGTNDVSNKFDLAEMMSKLQNNSKSHARKISSIIIYQFDHVLTTLPTKVTKLEDEFEFDNDHNGNNNNNNNLTKNYTLDNVDLLLLESIFGGEERLNALKEHLFKMSSSIQSTVNLNDGDDGNLDTYDDMTNPKCFLFSHTRHTYFITVLLKKIGLLKYFTSKINSNINNEQLQISQLQHVIFGFDHPLMLENEQKIDVIILKLIRYLKQDNDDACILYIGNDTNIIENIEQIQGCNAYHVESKGMLTTDMKTIEIKFLKNINTPSVPLGEK